MNTYFEAPKFVHKWSAAMLTASLVLVTIVPVLSLPKVAEASTTVTLGASKDTYVDQDNPTKNEGNDDLMEVRSRDGSRNKRALIEFSLSSIPAGATIQSATLTLSMKNAPHASRTYNVHRITSSWIEGNGGTDNIPPGEVRWNNQPATTTSVTSATSTGATNDVNRSWDVTSDVQAFINGSASNFGWLIKDSVENSTQSDLEGRFRTRENTDSSNSKQPKLVVVYNVAPAHLIVIKHVVNDNGGTAVASDFTMTINSVTASGGNSFPGVEFLGTDKTITSFGSYSVTESGPAGYAQSASPDCSGTIASGETKTCTITNDDIGGTLKIKKQTIGGFGTFGFTVENEDNDGLPGFDLTTSGEDNPAVQSFFDIFTDVYNIGESTAPDGWDQTNAYCDNDDQVNAVHVGLGQTVTCMFENTHRGKIIVVKDTVPNDGTSFHFDASYNGEGFDLSDGQSNDSGWLTPSTYSVSEVINPDYTTVGTCDDGSTLPNVGVSAGEIVTCTFTNTIKQGGITIVKQTQPGDSEEEFNFTSNYDGVFSLSDGDSHGPISVDPGEYSVSENVPEGWEVAIDCEGTAGFSVNGNGASINMGPDQSVSCVFTNTKHGHLVVTKVTDPEDTETEFSITASGDGTIFGDATRIITDGDSVDYEVTPGTYSVSEDVLPDGWALDSNGCEQIPVGAGETEECTITNVIPPTDVTPPASQFDNSRDHETIDTELITLSLTGFSTDDFPGVISGVASAEINIYKVAGEESLSGESFESLSCDRNNEVPIELVALNLVSSNPITMDGSSGDVERDWSYDWSPSGRGVYCFVVHATDVAGNVEDTAVAGPFAYIFTPPTPPPTPPEEPPVHRTQGQFNRGPQGSVLGAFTGQVLGESCGLYMDRFIRSGSRYNNAEQVEKLQRFLNKWMDTSLQINGIYDSSTLAALQAFQTKYASEILTPWGLSGPTGIVYLTTLRWINMLECPDLALALPSLISWSQNPNVPKEPLATAPSTPAPSPTPASETSTSEEVGEPSSSLPAAAVQAEEGTGGFWNFLKGLFGN
jgi:hypothetical protein